MYPVQGYRTSPRSSETETEHSVLRRVQDKHATVALTVAFLLYSTVSTVIFQACFSFGGRRVFYGLSREVVVVVCMGVFCCCCCLFLLFCGTLCLLLYVWRYDFGGSPWSYLRGIVARSSLFNLYPVGCRIRTMVVVNWYAPRWRRI